MYDLNLKTLIQPRLINFYSLAKKKEKYDSLYLYCSIDRNAAVVLFNACTSDFFTNPKQRTQQKSQPSRREVEQAPLTMYGITSRLESSVAAIEIWTLSRCYKGGGV